RRRNSEAIEKIEAQGRLLENLKKSNAEYANRLKQLSENLQLVRLELQYYREKDSIQNRMIDILSREVEKILSGRRYRASLALVKLMEAARLRAKGDPLEYHLGRHMRWFRDALEKLEKKRPAGGERDGTGPERTEKEDKYPRGKGGWHRCPYNSPFYPLRKYVTGRDMKLVPRPERKALVQRLLGRKQKTLVSIVMPTWNRAEQISEAIESVRRQLYKNWELLVVDDGSTDATSKVVGAYAKCDSRIRYLPGEHRGVSEARNRGLKKSSGRIVAYLDSDNVWDDDFLLLMVNLLEDTGANAAYSALRRVDGRSGKQLEPRRRTFDITALKRNNYVDINCFVHTRRLVDELGGFDPSLKRWVDWDLILRYAEKEPLIELPIDASEYRVNPSINQITSTQSEAYKMVVLNKHIIDWEELVKRVSGAPEHDVAIVIPVYGQSELTAKCIESIFTNTSNRYRFEVIVVDNGSADDTRHVIEGLRDRHKSLRLVTNYENYGFALGCNIGASHATSRYLVFLNNDTEVQRGWLDELIGPLERDERIGCVGSMLVFPDGKVQSCGMVFSKKSKIPYHLYQGFPADDEAVNKPRFLQVVSAACISIRSTDFVEIGGFNPIYLNGCEDLELCFRIRHELDKLVLYNPRSTVIHHEGRTEGRGRAIMYNRELFVQRWGEKVQPDDEGIYCEDGFSVVEYAKPGSEPHGETAAYYARVERNFEACEVPYVPGIEKHDGQEGDQGITAMQNRT
ncbi:MAG: glycosyltransferase, partial [Deltaproteobacteria bacterium]